MPRSVHRSKEIDRSIPCRALGTTRILPRQTEVLEAAAQRPTPRWSVPHPADRLHGSPCLFLAPHVLNDLAVMPSPPPLEHRFRPVSRPTRERRLRRVHDLGPILGVQRV